MKASAEARRWRGFAALVLAAAGAALGSGPAAAAGNAPRPEAPDTYSDQLANDARDKFDRVRFMDPFSLHLILKHDPSDPLPYFFYPPRPPTLDTDIPFLAPLDSGPPAPPQLAAFVNELFYPMLASRLAYDELPRELRAKILAYRDAKLRLQSELRARLAALKDAEPEERRAQLAQASAAQAAGMASLDAAAENLRTLLRPTSLLGATLDSPEMDPRQRWVIHPVEATPSDHEGLGREAEALRYAAFFESGLPAPQRRLLLEAALELREAARGPGGTLVPTRRTLAFSPATSRILLPDALPAALQEPVDAYAAAKDALKAEIRNLLSAQVQSTERDRLEAIRRLAADQGPRLARLESLAEAIRSGLAALPSVSGPPVQPLLPPELTARIAAYRLHKIEILKRLREMITLPTPAADGEDGPTPRPTPIGGLGAGPLTWLHDGPTTTEVQSTDLRVSVSDFDKLQGQLISELNREEQGIREALAAHVRAANGPADRKSINDLLRDFDNARQRQEIWNRYRDYRTAVLLPGLTPGQRQLLFDSGIEYLGLPLPAGEKHAEEEPRR